MTAEVVSGDSGHKRGVDVGDRQLSSGVSLQQLARQPAEAGPEFENLRRGDIGHLIKHHLGQFRVSTEESSPSGAVERADDLLLQIVDVVAVQVFQPVGLQPTIQPRGLRPASGHTHNVEGHPVHVDHHG